MLADVRAFLREPGPERPKGISRLDRTLAISAAIGIVLEGSLREGLVGRPYQIAIGLILVCAFWVRRERPLLAVAIAFGSATVSTLASQILPSPRVALHTTAIVLLLPYSLARWGSGRAVLLGLAVIASTYAASAIHGEMPNAPDYIGGAVTMLFPVALGTAFRFRAAAHRRAIEHAKLLERAQIARDLHDTIAHHVSAIAVQAQAGRAVFASQPDAALRTLGTIEAEATRALAEMRSMVRALRDDEATRLAPQHGVADIERLATPTRDGPHGAVGVEVALGPGVDRLGPATQAALYRIAQESITNAVRHARGAKRVSVDIRAEEAGVRLTVKDDGTAAPLRAPWGFGLVGMAERAAILGGKLDAGPRDGGGWQVEVVLPQDGA